MLKNQYRVSVRDDGKVLVTDSGDGCTTVPPNCTPKTGSNGIFYVVYVTTIFKRESQAGFCRRLTNRYLICQPLSSPPPRQAFLPPRISLSIAFCQAGVFHFCFYFLHLLPPESIIALRGSVPLTAIICTCKSESPGQSFNDSLFGGGGGGDCMR